jgi:cytidylate kinase
VIVAIDGPAGAGKSSVARAVADALGFTYLDTGAMYRAVALAGRADADVGLTDDGRVVLDGRDVSDEIRTPEASERASRAAADPEVRTAMVARQRALIAHGDWVAEGRDIGTVVAPQAELKIFLTASPEERAHRRAAQLGTDVQTVLKDQALRDERDRSREHSPLMAAEDAVEVDTTGVPEAEVVSRIVKLVGARR